VTASPFWNTHAAAIVNEIRSLSNRLDRRLERIQARLDDLEAA
jgi:hypothetical protein